MYIVIMDTHIKIECTLYYCLFQRWLLVLLFFFFVFCLFVCLEFYYSVRDEYLYVKFPSLRCGGAEATGLGFVCLLLSIIVC